MPDPILEEVRRVKAEQDAEDSAARLALGNPLPGPTALALAVNQDIPVGKWKVRPLCDGDYDVLKSMNHPICKVMEAQFEMAFNGKTDLDINLREFVPRGPDMRCLAWQMTRPPKVVCKTVKTGGVESLRALAEDEFFEVPTPMLAQLYLAVAQQISTAWSTTQSYGPVPKDGEDAAAVAPENPTR